MFGWAITFLIVALIEALLDLSGIARGGAKRRLKELERRPQACEITWRSPLSGAPGDEPSRQSVQLGN